MTPDVNARSTRAEGKLVGYIRARATSRLPPHGVRYSGRIPYSQWIRLHLRIFLSYRTAHLFSRNRAFHKHLREVSKPQSMG